MESEAVRDRLVSLAVVDRVGPADRIVGDFDLQFEQVVEGEALEWFAPRLERAKERE